MSVRILVTGGTFDKEYDMIDGDLHFTETHIPGILELGRCTVDYSIRTLMMVDSLEMTETDRDIIKPMPYLILEVLWLLYKPYQSGYISL